ncbi:MAG: aminoacyl-tRNA hydrolase [Paracoccaceae bacterium]
MKLMVGLGNPEKKHLKTRHNVGYLAVTKIAENNNFSNWREKFQGYISNGVLNSEKIIILKPTTYMNLSGQSVGELIRFHKIATKDVIVFHDDIDLTLAKVKVKVGGGHAGHNGLRSVDQHIGSEYIRIRIGVGRPTNKSSVADYVLNNFSKPEIKIIEKLITNISDSTGYLITEQNPEFIKAVSRNFQSLTKENIRTKQNVEEENKIENINIKKNFLQKLFKKFKDGSENG